MPLMILIAAIGLWYWTSIQVAVRPGDVQGMGQAAPNVTHTAMLRKDGVDQLGLRLQFVPDTSEVRIVGYWLPQAASGP